MATCTPYNLVKKGTDPKNAEGSPRDNSELTASNMAMFDGAFLSVKISIPGLGGDEEEEDEDESSPPPMPGSPPPMPGDSEDSERLRDPEGTVEKAANAKSIGRDPQIQKPASN